MQRIAARCVATGLCILVCGCNAFDEQLLADLQSDGGSTFDESMVPPRPSTSDGPDAEPITVALRDVVLNQSMERWREIGLNLDGLDTTLENPETECVPPDTAEGVTLDGNDGIDNAFGSRFFPVVTVVPELEFLEDDARAAQEAGEGTLVLRMSDWNGTENDPHVTVVVSQAVAGTSADPADVELDGFDLVMTSDGSPAPPPAWDGNDNWFLRDEGFVNGDPTRPLVSDDNGYVADGVVVFRLPDRAEILFFVGDLGVRVRLTDATAIGVANAEFDGLTDAMVTGRWSIIDLIDTGQNINICEGSLEMTILTEQLDRIADVRSQPGTGGPGATCNAISMAVRFQSAVKGNWIGLAASPPLPNPCEMP